MAIWYGSAVASTTLTTAGQLSLNSTGGVETNTTSTSTDSSGLNMWYEEVWALGGSVGDSASIPSPTGRGWLYDSTFLEGKTIPSGNWSAAISEDDTGGFTAITFIVRSYKRSSSGVYTSIGSMQVANQSMSGTKTLYNIPNTSMVAMSFGIGDKLYLDHFLLPTTGHWSSDPIRIYLSNSSTLGVTNDFMITSPNPISSNVNSRIVISDSMSPAYLPGLYS